MLAVIVVSLLAFRGTIAAQARAAGTLAVLLETPGASTAVLRLTDPPRVDEIVLAGAPTTLVRPRGEGPWPAVLFVNGATPNGRREPQVRRLARALARTGHVVLVPDLTGLQAGELSAATREATIAAATAAAERPDAQSGRVALMGVSVGATLALLAAESRPLGESVSVVAGVAPYADLENVIRVATTASSREGGRTVRFEPEPFLLLVVARSLATTLPDADRAIFDAALAGLSDSGAAAGLAGVPGAALAAMGPDGRAVALLLLNRDPARFDALYRALPPGVRRAVRGLSPIHDARRIAAPVELVAPPRDKYFPRAEAAALVREAPAGRLTVTATLDHTDLRPTLGEAGSLLRLDGWVVRTLRAMRAP